MPRWTLDDLIRFKRRNAAAGATSACEIARGPGFVVPPASSEHSLAEPKGNEGSKVASVPLSIGSQRATGPNHVSTPRHDLRADTYLCKMVIYHTVPSLNRLFAMNHWQRRREKKATQAAFLSMLKASGADSSTTTICAQSFLSTAFATPGSSRTTPRKYALSSRLSAKFAKVNRLARKSRSRH